MSANTPPKPHTEGMVFTNDETGIKYQFSGGAWRAVSSSASEEVAEAIDNLDLQKVLDTGNVADKGAEFNGKVTVDPGTQDNEVVTYGQLATVAEELEQLAPSFERGIYSISTQEVTSSSTHNGKYNLIRKNTSSDGNAARAACADAQNLCNRIPDNDPIDCQIEYNRCIDAIPSPGTVDIYISDFSQVEQLKFSKVDVNGENHTWDGVLIGQLIDVFNEDNDNYMVGRITAIEGTTVKTFSVDVLSSKGSASGNARIKVFSLSETGDVTNYVRKTGDTMTGILETTSNIWIRPNDQGAKGSGNMLVVNQSSEAGGSIARFQKDNKDIMKIASDNIDCNNHRIISVGKPTGEKDAVNMEYLKEDEYVHAPAHLSWAYSSTDSRDTPRDTNFSRDDLNIWRFSLQTRDGVDLSQTLIDDTNVHSSEFLMSIWFKPSAGGWALKRIVRCKKFRWGIKDSKGHHFEIHQSDNFGTGLANGGRYYVTIAGLF
tara:strand:- start:403 stop:1866 length:1464 start_codon:yes stop_codon:yes gene_type:complete